jgi:hypothetical protein
VGPRKTVPKFGEDWVETTTGTEFPLVLRLNIPKLFNQCRVSWLASQRQHGSSARRSVNLSCGLAGCKVWAPFINSAANRHLCATANLMDLLKPSETRRRLAGAMVRRTPGARLTKPLL